MEEKDKKPMTKAEEAVRTLGYVLHEECKNFAINQMVESDFILLSDANHKKTLGISMTRGNERQFYTIKRSSEQKYVEFYDKKLENIIEKFMKSNA